MYNESMITVLDWEVIGYNRLLVVVGKMLKDAQLVFKGDIVISDDLD